MSRSGCYDPTELYRPQWAYPTPAGFRDEVFILGPFALPISGTGHLDLNLPVQLDDDTQYFIRAIFAGKPIGDAFANTPFANPASAGMLVRIRDCYGNPLSDGLVLALGNWANSADGLNGFGWVVEPEVECPPGGTLLFDFLASSNGGPSTLTVTDGIGGGVEFIAAVLSTAGNLVSVTIVNPGTPSHALTVGVVANAVTITLATDGGSALVSTWTQVAAAVNASAAARALLFAVTLGASPGNTAIANPLTLLSGFSAGTPFTLFACFEGIKRFRECL